MLPNDYSDELKQDFTVVRQTGRTYRLRFDGFPSSGMLDGAEAIRQTIYMILVSERYRYEMFSWDYGVELEKCMEESDPVLLQIKLEDAISEALTQDDRILRVEEFEAERRGRQLAVSFVVVTTEGDVPSEAVFGENGLEAVR